MIRHIVLWTFKENAGGREKQENIDSAKEKLLNLKNHIDVIKHIECCRNFTETPDSVDLALMCEFETKADLEKYQTHPAHLDVVQFMRTVRDKRIVADYEF
jgi:hypothetical protein